MNSLKYISQPNSLINTIITYISPPSNAPTTENKPNKKHRRKSITNTNLPSIHRLVNVAKRKTLVLDLDETLIHSQTRDYHLNSTLIEVHLKSSKISTFYYVRKRPHCLLFLQSCCQWYELAIYTASVKEYADPIIDMLEQELGFKCFKNRFYRDQCTQLSNGGYAKDLNVLGDFDLGQVLLVDNSMLSFMLQPQNGLLLDGWISDPSDRCLLQVLPLLCALSYTSDVRSVLALANTAKFDMK